MKQMKSWKTRTMIIGLIAGAVTGLAAAHVAPLRRACHRISRAGAASPRPAPGGPCGRMTADAVRRRW